MSSTSPLVRRLPQPASHALLRAAPCPVASSARARTVRALGGEQRERCVPAVLPIFETAALGVAHVNYYMPLCFSIAIVLGSIYGGVHFPPAARHMRVALI